MASLANILVIVKPETVIGSQRAGFRLYRQWGGSNPIRRMGG